MGTTFIFTVVILSVLGLLLAVVLFLVAKKFQVVEDPLIDVVEATMPGANAEAADSPAAGPLPRPASSPGPWTASSVL